MPLPTTPEESEESEVPPTAVPSPTKEDTEPKSGLAEQPALLQPRNSPPSRPGVRRSVLGQVYEDIRKYRAELKDVNVEIEREQQAAKQRARTGEGISGWVLVGTGLGHLKHARLVEGMTREDVLWDNVGQSSGVGMFWCKVGLVGIVLAMWSESAWLCIDDWG